MTETKTVPIDPTGPMILAGQKAVGFDIAGPNIEAIWTAMVAATPLVDQVGGDVTGVEMLPVGHFKPESPTIFQTILDRLTAIEARLMEIEQPTYIVGMGPTGEPVSFERMPSTGQRGEALRHIAKLKTVAREMDGVAKDFGGVPPIGPRWTGTV